MSSGIPQDCANRLLASRETVGESEMAECLSIQSERLSSKALDRMVSGDDQLRKQSLLLSIVPSYAGNLFMTQGLHRLNA